MGKLRSIRLKERDPNQTVEFTPEERFAKMADGTLKRGPFTIRTDGHGFIKTGNLINLDEPPLAMLGGSFVEASYADETTRFASQVERQLDGYRILNGGYSGSTTLQLFNVMLNKVYPIIGKQGKLVFFVGQSDADVFNRSGSYWTDAKLWSPLVPGVPPSVNLPNGAQPVRQVVSIVIDTARTLGIDLILAVSPFRNGNFNTDRVLRRAYMRDRSIYTRRLADRNEIRRAALEVGRRKSIEVIDFQELTGGPPEWFYDALHLNEHGHDEFTKVLTRTLRARL